MENEQTPAAQRYTSRKFQLTVASFVVCTVALFVEKLSGAEFIDIITMILGLYGLSNVGAAYVSNKGT